MAAFYPLPGPLKEQLHSLLLGSFDNSSMHIFLSIQMETDFENISSTQKNKEERFLDVIGWANRNGRLLEFVQKAAKERPHINEFEELTSKIEAEFNARSERVGKSRIDDIIVNNIQEVRFDYAGRIKNFLIDYLGVPGQPVPFGGRKKELAGLQTWIEDEGAPPYALLAAPAGRGKSALLARFLRRLDPEIVAVAFVPVSVRYNTALSSVVFAALAAQLAVAYGEKMPESFRNFSGDEWRNMCLSYFNQPPPSGKQVLVILDGLDEASDWQAGPDLFPSVPPKGLRVLVSARYLGGDQDSRGWLQRLGWNRSDRARMFELPILTREGVRDVLAAMGNPLNELAGRVNFVEQLFRLSEGDPLLVRLYVEALLPTGDRPAVLQQDNLPDIPPGLDGYFQQWWADQRVLWGAKTPLREPGITALLNILALALGPLRREDVLAIAPPDSRLDSWLLDEAVQSMARFVIGDGRKVGYSFSHPKLGYYHYDRLVPSEKQAWETRFLAYGQDQLTALEAGTLAPKEASPYMTEHYGAHLERSNAPPESFYALVSNGRQRAWYALEGVYGGFLQDVQRVEKATAGQRNIPVIVRCALCRASVTALSSNIPPELLSWALAERALSPRQALILAAQISDENQRAEALAGLGPYLPPELLGEALAIARNIGDEWSRAGALADLGLVLPAEGKKQVLGEALALTHHIGEERWRAYALQGLGPFLPSELMGEAIAIVRNIGDEVWQTVALAGLAPHIPPELLAEALEIARNIEDDIDQTKALTELGPHLPAQEREQVLEEALTKVFRIEDQWSRMEALTRLIPHLLPRVRKQVLGKALIAARTVEGEWTQAEMLAGLGPHLLPELMEKALAIAHSIRDEHCRAIALVGLGLHLSNGMREQVLGEALADVRHIEDERLRVETLSRLGPNLPAGEREQVLGEALATAQLIEEEIPRVGAFAELWSHLPPDLLGEMLVAVRYIVDEKLRMTALTGLGPHLPVEERKQVLEEALAAAHHIADEGSQASVLAVLGPHLPLELLEEVLAMVHHIGNEWSRVETLAGLGLLLPSGKREQVLEEALSAAHNTGAEGLHAQVLDKLGPYLSPNLLREELSAACQIGDESIRAKALAELGPYLTPELLDEALQAARLIWYEFPRAKALTSLGQYLPAGEREQVFDEALAAALNIGIGGIWDLSLAGLGPHLSPLQLEMVLEAPHNIWDETFLVQALAVLGPHLPPELLEKAFAIVHNLEDKQDRALALARLGPILPPEQLRETLAELYQIKDDKLRAEVLAGLGPHLPPDLFGEALAIAHQIEDEGAQVEALAGLGPYLPKTLLIKAFEIVLQIGNDWSRERALTGLGPHMPPEFFGEALAVARQIEDEWVRARTLVRLVPHMPIGEREEVLGEALATAHQIWEEESRAEALGELGLHLPAGEREAVLGEALSTMRKIEDAGTRAEALARLGPHLPPELIGEALAAVCQIGDEVSRIWVLAELAKTLIEWGVQDRTKAFNAWCQTIHVLETRPRPEFLSDLKAIMPFTLALVPQAEQETAAMEIFRTIQDVCSWWP